MATPIALLKKAKELLPTCKSLSDAEACFGGVFNAMSGRDYQKAAVTWGLFDGFNARPRVDFIKPEYNAIYFEAWDVGAKMR